MDIKGLNDSVVGLNDSVDIKINSMGQEYQFESVGRFGNVLAETYNLFNTVRQHELTSPGPGLIQNLQIII